MIERIQRALEKEGIELYRIVSCREQRAELYFIKKDLDLPRFADITVCTVEVFRDFEEDGKRYRGFTNTKIAPGTSDEEIGRKVREAYFAAGFVKNPWFELPDPVAEEKKGSASDLRGRDLAKVAEAFAEAVFAVPSDEQAFVNSLEIYAEHTERSIIVSNGLQVSFDEDRVRGEFVAQCRTPVDVEQFRQFSYDSFDTEALQQKIEDGIRDVRLRAAAKSAPKNGTCNILLTGEHVRELLSYYEFRANASVIFPHYSDWKIGDHVQQEGTGEALKLTLKATAPYSSEGIPMKDRVLIEDGVLKTVHGGTRFCRYLGTEPTGEYRKLLCENGSMDLHEMRTRGPVLECVSFSDFQTDFMGGTFGGEMRLSLLHENGSTTPLSGGSVNGRIADIEGKLIFSKERYSDSTYEGPYAVLIPDVPIAGE
ncbi:MAG: hypothetical protein IKI54_06450 [Lachnospiraceae bacterium]|nr:hypothetical protein [Lachnospiraceae bacterium]